MSAQLAFHCPHCRSPVPASPARMGQTIPCPVCGKEFRLTPANMGGAAFTMPQVAPAGAPAGGNSPAAPTVPQSAPAAPAAGPVLPAPAQPSVPAVASGPTLPTPAPAGPVYPSPAAAAPNAAPVPGSPAGPTAKTARFIVPVGPPPGAQPAPAAVLPPVPVPAPRPVAPAPPPAAKKAAKFLAPAPAISTIALSPDGKLPELHLLEAATHKKTDKKTSSNPLVVASVLFISLAVCLLLIFADPNATPTDTTLNVNQRAKIQKYIDGPSPNLQPYQLLLRDALRAHGRGDLKTEKNCYHKVLQLLRSEGRDPFRGLTGTKSKDQELENLLTNLVREEES